MARLRMGQDCGFEVTVRGRGAGYAGIAGRSGGARSSVGTGVGGESKERERLLDFVSAENSIEGSVSRSRIAVSWRASMLQVP